MMFGASVSKLIVLKFRCSLSHIISFLPTAADENKYMQKHSSKNYILCKREQAWNLQYQTCTTPAKQGNGGIDLFLHQIKVYAGLQYLFQAATDFIEN